MEQIIAQREVCPSWIIADNRSSTGCFSDTVVCCGTLLHLGNCMTYNSTSDTIEHGPYPYIGHYNTINKNLCMGHVITFPTILLILYLTRLFRRCVSCCGFRRWHALHMFVESFQGQYKDGTNGTRDFRTVFASFLILRILILFLFLNHHHLPTHTSEIQGDSFHVLHVCML